MTHDISRDLKAIVEIIIAKSCSYLKINRVHSNSVAENLIGNDNLMLPSSLTFHSNLQSTSFRPKVFTLEDKSFTFYSPTLTRVQLAEASELFMGQLNGVSQNQDG